MFNPNPNSDIIGFGLFNNATRQQVKDLTKPTTCQPQTQTQLEPQQPQSLLQSQIQSLLQSQK